MVIAEGSVCFVSVDNERRCAQTQFKRNPWAPVAQIKVVKIADKVQK